MNTKLRKKTVLAMELLVRQVNNESLIEPWLMCGVPDGDINRYEEDEVDESLIEKENYSELMALFLKIMTKANKSGLYSDNVLSKRNEE